jgi:membrane peptidoglycan carboxypeptidase
VIEDNSRRKGRRVLDQAVADTVTDVLKGVVGGGTGKAADIGRPGATAGKTGTSENFGNAWFVGFTPALSAAVWMGYADTPRPLEGIKGVGKVYGGTIPAQTWHDFMADAMKGVDTPDFPAPGPLPGDLGPGDRKEPLVPPTGPYVVGISPGQVAPGPGATGSPPTPPAGPTTTTPHR